MNVLGRGIDLRWVYYLMPAALFVELLAFGANGPLLAAAASVLEILAAIAIIAVAPPDHRFWIGAWPVLLVVTLMIGWVAVPGVVPGLATQVPRYAPDMLKPSIARLFGGAAVLLAGAMAGYRLGMTRRSIDALILLGIVQIIVGLALREHDPEHVWGYDKGFLVDRFTGTFLNANASGCLFGVVALLGLGRWLDALRLTTKPFRSDSIALWLGPLAIVSGAGACAITGSRTALALLFPALVVVALCDRELRFRMRRQRIAAAAIAIGALAGFALMLFTVGAATLDRLSSAQADSIGRFEIWTFFERVAAASPLIGYGPGGFDEAHLHAMHSVQEARDLWFVNSAHNEVLSLLLFGGWPYLALMIGAVGLMLAKIFRHRRSRMQDPILRSMLAALLLMLSCAMDDIALDVPALASLAIFLGGLAWGRALRIAAERSASFASPADQDLSYAADEGRAAAA